MYWQAPSITITFFLAFLEKNPEFEDKWPVWTACYISDDFIDSDQV
jgi:hypothetical protein